MEIDSHKITATVNEDGEILIISREYTTIKDMADFVRTCGILSAEP